jgi:hypothetical protein
MSSSLSGAGNSEHREISPLFAKNHDEASPFDIGKCCHMFKPKNMTDDIFLAQILGHKLLGPNASLSVGQSYKDFYVVGA